MTPSPKIKQLIKNFEGLSLTPYRCPAGVLTIGYGHTGPDVHPGLTLTPAQADALFDSDIARFAAALSPLLSGIPLSQNQFDALLSLAYNIGIPALAKSTLLRLVRANPADPAIRTQFSRWVHAAGRTLPGLVHRRTVEANHYFATL